MIFHQYLNSLGNYNYNAFIYEQCEWMHHFHKNFELVYVIEGEIEIQVNNKKENAAAGSFALVLQNDIHSYHTEKYSKVWIGVFSEDYVNTFANFIHGKKSENIVFKCSAAEFTYLKNVIINESKPDLFSLKAALYVICSRYLKEVKLKESNKYDNDLAHKTINYMENNFRKDITLKDIAKELGYDYCYFSKYFNHMFNINFKTFLNQYRFEYSKKLILTTNMNMTEIAMESGFGSLRNFNRIYKQISGETPSAARIFLPK